MSYDTDIARGHPDITTSFSSQQGDPGIAPIGVPIADGGAGLGGGMAHAANEYYVIEGAGKIYGMAGAEKSFATILDNHANAPGALPYGFAAFCCSCSAMMA